MGSQPSQPVRKQYTKQQPKPTLNKIVQPRNYPVRQERAQHADESGTWADPVPQTRPRDDGGLVWPLPPSEAYGRFEIGDSELERFLMPPLSPRPVSPSPSKGISATATEPYNENDDDTMAWSKTVDTQLDRSAHVQTQLSMRFHACYNLSAVDNIGLVINGIRKTQGDLDERLKTRLGKISNEAEGKIVLVINDTKKQQKRLVVYDKERQRRHQELYQEWLQKYIVELNKWRAKQLAILQDELLGYQKAIVKLSRKRIEYINQEANQRKTDVLEEEKTAALTKARELTGQIYDIQREDGQHLGSESKAELNLRIQANAGTIAPGQGCTADFPV